MTAYYKVDGTTLVLNVVPNERTVFPVIADPEFTWGYVSGTVYFTKSETASIAYDGAVVIDTLTGWLAFTAPAWVVAIVGAAIASYAATLWLWAVFAHLANQRWGANKCLKVKVGVTWSWTSGWTPGITPGHYTCGSR